MAWKPKQPKYPWRSYLTADEAATLKRANAAKTEWLKLNRERAAITNRAIQRAKYDFKARQPRGRRPKGSSVAADKISDTCRPSNP